jgi:hypothetical protein
MKVTLDLSDLVARGELDEALAARLQKLAIQETNTLGISIVIGFGIVAVIAGIGVLLPTPITAIALGIILFGVGIGLRYARAARWEIVAQICLTLGAILLTGGVAAFFAYGWLTLLGMAVALALATVVARSALLAALAVLTLGSALGGVGLEWPQTGLALVVFAPLILALYLVSLRVPPAYERIALVAARTAILLFSVAFFLGTLIGDKTFGLTTDQLTIGWALVLIATGAWAATQGRRWVVNAVAIFGAIHFFTQWFIRLGANAGTILGAGVLVLLFGIGLWMFNQRARRPSPPQAPLAT